MQSKATLRHLRIAPRKVRLVAELIRGKKVSDAYNVLKFSRKSATGPLEKLLRSALASLAHGIEIDEANVYISSVAVQEGTKLKRYRPRARGRAYEIQKKTSDIALVLNEIVPTKPDSKKEKVEAQKIVQAKSKKPPKTDGSEKQKFTFAKEVAKPKTEGGLKRIFRRKAV